MTLNTEQKELFKRAQDAVVGKDLRLAIKLLKQLLLEVADSGPVNLLLGRVYAGHNQPKLAEEHLRKAIQVMPGQVEPWLGLGHFYRQQKAFGRARAAYEKAAQLAPEDVKILQELVRLQRLTRDLTAALATAEKILVLSPGNLDAQIQKAEILAAMGKEKEALEVYAALVKKGGDIPNKALERWVQLMMKFERTEETVGWLEKQVAANPGVFLLKLLLSGCYVHLGLHEKAMVNLEAANTLEPDNLRVMHDLGVVLRFMGRIEESKTWFARSLEKDPFHVSSLRVYGAEHRYEYGDESFRRLMKAVAHLSEYTVPARVQLHYALGKAFDDVGDFGAAFEHFAQGGKLHLRQAGQDRREENVFLPFVRKHVQRKLLDNPGESGCLSDKPIFVLGMPRSGTSLVEQVLASHPDVYGAGELKFLTKVLHGIRVGKLKLDLQHRSPVFPISETVGYEARGQRYVKMMEDFAQTDAKRITDKMPGNYMWVGLIRLILPKVAIIHTRRHPLETCLSAYRIFFPDGQYWSYDLKEMGEAYRRYDEIMQHWRENLPVGSMHEVRYEDMVNDFENQARQLIAYCGLEWNDACLNFHETDRAVRTASASQVRKPVYKTSIGRWHKYEPYLKPLMEEVGPLVQVYEDELAAPSLREQTDQEGRYI